VLAARPSRQLVGSIAEATKGNPLLVRLLVDRLAAEDQLIVTGDRVVSRRDPEHFLVASDMEAAWQQRLDQLQPSDRMLLELAALLGDESSIDDLQTVAGAGADHRAHGFLDRSEHAGLLAEIDARYRFAHPHLRSALVAGLPGRRRARRGAQIASRLWLRYRDHGGTRLLEILHHLRVPGRTRREASATAGSYRSAVGTCSSRRSPRSTC